MNSIIRVHMRLIRRSLWTTY